MLGKFLSSAVILKHYFFFKIYFREKHQECQTAWIQIWPDVLLGLTWVQTVYKDDQQTTKFVSAHTEYFMGWLHYIAFTVNPAL